MITLDANDQESLVNYLHEKKWLQPDETIISAEKPGEGNMNYVLRINTGTRTFIIKQARPYVEKYPQVPAPTGRAEVEAAFYSTIQQDDTLMQSTPLLLATDTENHILVLQDLGAASDYTHLYKNDETLSRSEADSLVAFLNQLHNRLHATKDPVLYNRDMRQLNHEHIFVYPFRSNNGLNLDDITPGLQEVAAPYIDNEKLQQQLKKLGDLYLGDGICLLHGDYYPGSWLRTATGVKVIDPEFCFFGPPEFDLAIMLAHGYLAGQPTEIIDQIKTTYNRSEHFDEVLLQQFEGVEIMRRLIGLAQLPLSLNLETKKQMLERASQLIMS